MMRYQPVNYNFIPKEQPKEELKEQPRETKEVKPKSGAQASFHRQMPTPAAQIDPLPPVETKMHQELQRQLEFSQGQVYALEQELHSARSQAREFEEKLRRWESFGPEGQEIGTLQVRLQELHQENEELKADLKKNKDHIQTLYFILVLVAIL